MVQIEKTVVGPPWRVEAYVDGPNLYKSVKDNFGWEGGYDLQKLIAKLAHGRHAGRPMRLQRIFYFTSDSGFALRGANLTRGARG